VTYFLGTVSATSPGNWSLAKEVGLWGVSSARLSTALKAQEGDHLIIWLAGSGYVANCQIAGPCRTPSTPNETPWDGGLDQWVGVVPLTVTLEVKYPIRLRFTGDRQEKTGLSKGWLRSSFQRLPDDIADRIADLLQEQSILEAEEGV
jgi:hypothetical protein